MHEMQRKFEYYIQTQQYVIADQLIQQLHDDEYIKKMQRAEALSLVYRLGYVYPEAVIQICKQRNDIPKPFIDVLKIELKQSVFTRYYNQADSLVAIKIALLNRQSFVANMLLKRFYKSYNLLAIDLVRSSKLTVGNNLKELKKQINKKKVSVIVTTYNSEKYIDNCIGSLLNQNLKNIEIIVVDDASTDNTILLLKKYGSLINLIELKKNRGTYKSRNVGIQSASGYYITFQDSDDWSHPQRLSIQMSNLEKNLNIVSNFSSFFRVDEISGLPTCRQLYPLLRLNLSSMMLRRSAIHEIGLFDSNQRVESDKKYLKKIESMYGTSSIHIIKKPLAIGSYRRNSLTTNENTGFNRYGFSKSRSLCD